MKSILWLLRHLLIWIAEKGVTVLKTETLILIHRINNTKTLAWFPSETTLILSATSSQNSLAFWHPHNAGDKVCPAHSHSQQAPCVSFKTLKRNSKPFTKCSYSGKLREHKYQAGLNTAMWWAQYWCQYKSEEAPLISVELNTHFLFQCKANKQKYQQIQTMENCHQSQVNASRE